MCFLYHPRDIPNGYIALGQFLFVLEQIKDFIINLGQALGGAKRTKENQ
jgi:hypothetical protein